MHLLPTPKPCQQHGHETSCVLPQLSPSSAQFSPCTGRLEPVGRRGRGDGSSPTLSRSARERAALGWELRPGVTLSVTKVSWGGTHHRTMGDSLLRCRGVLGLTVVPVPVQAGPCHYNSACGRAAFPCASVGACPCLGGTEVTRCVGQQLQPSHPRGRAVHRNTRPGQHRRAGPPAPRAASCLIPVVFHPFWLPRAGRCWH